MTHEASVRHAIVALGALHRHFEGLHTNSIDDLPMSLDHYGKSIHYMLHVKDSAHPLNVALISCLLYIVYESLSGNLKGVLTHLQSGILMLEQQSSENDDRLSAYVPRNILAGLLARVNRQVGDIIGSNLRDPVPVSSPDIENPSNFRNIDDAVIALEKFDRHFFQFANDLYDDPTNPTKLGLSVEECHIYHQILSEWFCKLDSWIDAQIEAGNLPQGRHAPSILILQIYRNFYTIALNREPSDQETAFDAFGSEWLSIVTLAAGLYPEVDEAIETPSTGSSNDSYSPYLAESAATPPSFQTTILKVPPRERPYLQPHMDQSRTQSPEGRQLQERPSPPPQRPIKLSNAGTPPARPRPEIVHKRAFSIVALPIIPILYFTAHRCRDPYIRRRAIAILYACRRRHVLWDGPMSATVAERIMEKEEANARVTDHFTGEPIPIVSAEQIPESARIQALYTNIEEKSGTLRYGSAGPQKGIPDQTVMPEMVVWDA